MVEAGADMCIAFDRTLEYSRGTKDCISQALAAGMPVYLITGEAGRPKRIEADDVRLT
jgi:hypothetical protein